MNIKSINCRFYFSFLLLFTFVLNSFAQSYFVNGKVSSEGKALENVVVTDGENTTVTNAKGSYKLNVSEHSRFVYISTPSGYLPQDNLNVPTFYKQLNGVHNAVHNFELIKNKKDDTNHVLLVHADPQFFKEEQFKLYEEVIEDCIETIAKYKTD